MKKIVYLVLLTLISCSKELVDLGSVTIAQTLNKSITVRPSELEHIYTISEESDWEVVEKEGDWFTFKNFVGRKNQNIIISIRKKIAEGPETGIFKIAYKSGTVEKVTVHLDPNKDIVVLQLNIWQEGTSVVGGYDAIVEEILRSKADFVMLSEVRNYSNTDFTQRLVTSLKGKGETYYSYKTYDSGILSKYEIIEEQIVYPLVNDQGSIHKLVAMVNGQRFAVYTAHLDYRHYASYLPRGYDGTSFLAIPAPITSLAAIKSMNLTSKRDEAISAFIVDAKAEVDRGAIIFFGGDFNEPSHLDWTVETKNLYDHNGVVYNWDISMMLQNAGFIDSYRKIYPSAVTHPGFTYPSDNKDKQPNELTWAPKADERERIDFIYYYPNVSLELKSSVILGPKSSIVKGVRVDETSSDPFILPLSTWPSDHKGLISTFKYERKNAN